MKYEAIICFETHAELKTRTKLFCNCAVATDAEPNTHICPVCTGQPGVLPVLNRSAVEFCIKAGLALHCRINPYSRFARKNYFYPDLPKGYQISQYELPLCWEGYLNVAGEDGNPYPVGIKRIHLEEDAGKLVHSSDSFEASDYSLADYNRAGVPLIEIVADHERNPLHSVEQAKDYLQKIQQILRYIGVSDAGIEKGQFRCDVNISLRRRNSPGFGDRVELKNMTSFKFISEALEYEIKRQSKILDASKTVAQETRLFDEAKKITRPMRSKEDAPDYRYFPDPDLLEVTIPEKLLEDIRQGIPELPDQRIKSLVGKYGIGLSDAIVLTKDRDAADYFEECLNYTSDAKRLVRWVTVELFGLLNAASLSLAECAVQPRQLAALVNLLSEGKITDNIGKSVLAGMLEKGGEPQEIIKQKGLQSIQDAGILEKLVDDVIVENPEIAEIIRKGSFKPVDFLMGQVMKKSKGQADPQMVRKLITRKLKV